MRYINNPIQYIKIKKNRPKEREGNIRFLLDFSLKKTLTTNSATIKITFKSKKQNERAARLAKGVLYLLSVRCKKSV